MKGLIMMLFTLGTLAVGCGGSSGSGGTGASGVASGKRLDSLTDAEKGQLCDWTNAKLGGYGASMDCGNGFSIAADDSQADCIANWFTTCSATVAQGEACANAQSCTDFAPSACAPLATCQ